MTQKLADAKLLRGIVFHDQQALASGRSVFLDAVQCRFQPLRRRGLRHKGESAAGKAMMPVFVQG